MKVNFNEIHNKEAKLSLSSKITLFLLGSKKARNFLGLLLLYIIICGIIFNIQLIF